MKVYTLIKESYSYWDNDYTCTVKTFVDKQSAVNYLALEKEEILEDVFNEIEYYFKDNNKPLTEESLKEFYEENSDVVYSFTSRYDYFHVYIEEWGYEDLRISEQDVMEFKL